MFKWFTNWVKRSPLLAYFVLVFGIEWLLVFLLAKVVPPMVALLIGSWLPNMIGVLVTGVTGGRAGLRRLFGRVVLWRFGARWYLVAVFVPITMALLTVGIAMLTGRGVLEFIPASQLLGLLLVDIFTGATGEELGWRGTALPRLQARWSPLVSSLVLGVLWGLYHLPSFLLSGLPLENAPLVPFMMAALGLTILVTWTFNRTGGSLIPVFLYHFTFNFAGGVTGIFASSSLIWLLAIICCAAAVGVVALDWARFTRPPDPHLGGD